jgi:HlyD family secretion protein
MASVSAPTNAALKRRVRQKTRTLPMIVVAVLVVGLVWFGWAKTHPAQDPNAKLLTAPVTRGDLLETISATGSVTAQTGAQVKIGSQITGTIKRLFADIGSFVKANQVIAELDLPDLEAQVAQSEASLSQSQSSLVAAQTRYAQQQTGVGMLHTQISSAVEQARADLRAAQARLNSAQATAQQQTVQTPQDVLRAQTAVSVARAALSTAQSNLKQTQASINLQIANAQEDLNQSKANAANSSSNLKRQQDLNVKGFVADALVDQAKAQALVDQSHIQASQQNLDLSKAKAAADLQSAHDLVTQAQQNVAAAQAALTTAQAGTYTVASRQADVQNARAAVNTSQAALQTALGNTTQNALKDQDVLQAQEAIKTAQDAVSVAKSQVDYQKAQLAKTVIRSPISGTVLQLAQQQGETLAAGLSAPTLIVVADLTRLQVDAYVDETDIGKVRMGQEADITVDAFPKAPFKGKVTKIASGSTIQNGVITYDVTFSIEKPSQKPGDMAGGSAMNSRGAGNAGGGGRGNAGAGSGQGRRGNGGGRRDITKILKPDMTASVVLQTGKRENVLLVPAESVKQGSRGSTVNVLTVVDGKKEVQPRPVKTGGSDGINTEISDGVKEGDIIVRAGLPDPNRRGGPSSPFGPSGKGGGGGKKGG